eukprot:6490330-Amphidinium_carterae.2
MTNGVKQEDIKKLNYDMHDDKNNQIVNQGTSAALQQRYQSLHQQVISARQARLEARQRVREAQHGNGQDGERVPKAPPQGVTVPTSRLPQPVKEYEEHKKGDTTPQHYRDRDRLQRLESLDEAELQRQAAQQETPKEQIAQVQEVQVEVHEVPDEVPQVDSSTTSTVVEQLYIKTIRTIKTSSTTKDSEESYRENILEYMKLNYNDENMISVAQELHEGVQVYMELDEIEDVMKKAREGDQDASRKLEIHQISMNFLEQSLWRQLEDRDGKIEEKE